MWNTHVYRQHSHAPQLLKYTLCKHGIFCADLLLMVTSAMKLGQDIFLSCCLYDAENKDESLWIYQNPTTYSNSTSKPEDGEVWLHARHSSFAYMYKMPSTSKHGLEFWWIWGYLGLLYKLENEIKTSIVVTWFFPCKVLPIFVEFLGKKSRQITFCIIHVCP